MKPGGTTPPIPAGLSPTERQLVEAFRGFTLSSSASFRTPCGTWQAACPGARLTLSVER